MDHPVLIRKANTNDHPFIFQLSPRLAEVAQLGWHTDEAVQDMQDNYIFEMLAETSMPNTTLIAELDSTPLGFIHVRTHRDGITGETCGTVPLLAVSPESQGFGVGKLLMSAAETWAKNLGCRLLHLEVFANNSKAQHFYQNLGFQPEMLHMIKTLE
ncbi:GNAT family N-acetyltransferase [Thalassotalea maritima]|uniref:GNAT family N-acetyltransferase n=1 Tax=Thalassotalea maritima TaxID=3242416 RepID=UPI00352799B4